MSLQTPMVSKHRLNANEFKLLYTCPSIRKYALLDLSLFLDVPSDNKEVCHVDVLLTTNGALEAPTINYTILTNIPMGLPEVSAEVNKIIVGAGQHVYVRLKGNGTLNVRVDGDEYNGEGVAKSGRLAYIRHSVIGVVELYRANNPLAIYTTATLSIINPTNKSQRAQVWITDGTEVKSINEASNLVNKVLIYTLEPGETVLLEDIGLKPNERIYVSNEVESLLYSLNGMIFSP